MAFTASRIDSMAAVAAASNVAVSNDANING